MFATTASGPAALQIASAFRQPSSLQARPYESAQPLRYIKYQGTNPISAPSHGGIARFRPLA